MSPSITLETPIIENKQFLLRDPMMIEDALFLKEHDDDDFSTDSWERVSNEELDDIVQITNTIMSPPASPRSPDADADADMSIKSESNDETKDLDPLDSPPVLIKMEGATSTKQTKKQISLNDSPETRAMKRERNRLAARRCRQKQKDRIDYLERDVKEIETENYKVENEIKLLRQQLKDLQNALINHDCMLKHNLSPRQQYYAMKF